MRQNDKQLGNGPVVHSPVGQWLSRENKKFLGWVIVFFAIGVVIAMAIAYPLLDRGESVFLAIGLGAAVGGCGAWFAFFIGRFLLSTLRLISRQGEDD